eukprot:scaffold209795_cov19-Tisochrysis_lutea.AAC.1
MFCCTVLAWLHTKDARKETSFSKVCFISGTTLHPWHKARDNREPYYMVDLQGKSERASNTYIKLEGGPYSIDLLLKAIHQRRKVGATDV